MSISGSSIAGDGAGGRTVMAEMAVTLSSSAGRRGDKDKHKIPPQKRVDEFWNKFTTKAPGKVTTVLPKNELAERLAKRKAAKQGASGAAEVGSAQASYDEAAASCRAKVEKIVQECRRVNQKYRDPHFDLEQDLKTGRRDCLESLDNIHSDVSDYDSDYDDGPFGGGAPRRAKKHGDRSRGLRTGGNDGKLGEDSPQGRTPGSKFSPRSVKRVGEIFDDPKFYIDGPTANDVRQGRDGDCWLMAALCTLSNKPGLIEKICVAHNQDVGVYGFVFYRDGEWVSEIIDDKLYLTKPDYDEAISLSGPNLERALWEDRERPDSEEIYRKTYQSNSGALYFAQCENQNETWLPLLEKAYAKAHSDYAAIEGGFTGEGIEDLTGGVTSGLFTTDILDKEYFWKEELMKVNQQFLFGCSTGLWGLGWGKRKGILEGHAYSVMKAVEVDGERLVLLRNPWGKGEWEGPWSDGSKEWTPEWLQKLNHRFGDDGAFWISYKDLLRKYQAFDRTRLFGPDWKITSIWTTLSVPWTLEYHDTKFAFTLARAGPVVLVLSQLDDRYFRGLEGQYQFGLGIRVHRAGEDDYLVRAQTGYRMTRSVNVELELEAGDYTVCVKLDARRQDWIKPVEDVISDNSQTRRDKVLRIGLAYDLAHSKARVIETAEEKAAREAYAKRKKSKQREKLRKVIQEEKERDRYFRIKHDEKRQKRIKRTKERQKAKEEKKKEKKAEAEKKRMEKEEASKEKEEEVVAEEKKARERDALKAMPGAKGEDAEKPGETKTAGAKKDNETTSSQAPESSQSSVGEDTPTTSSPSSSSKDVPVPQGIVDDGGDQPNMEAQKPSAKTTSDGSGSTEKPKEAESTAKEDQKPENVQEAGTAGKGPVEPARKEAESYPEVESNINERPKPHAPLSAEVDNKIRRALGVFADLKDELEAMLGGSKFVDEEPHPDDDPWSMPYHTPKPHVSFPGGHPPPPPPMPASGHDWPSTRPPPPPPPPRSVVDQDEDEHDDQVSVTSVSDMSETELDYHFKNLRKDAELAASRKQNQPAPEDAQAKVPLDSEDEFEKDPWNAVAVVGLRVYYKVMDGDNKDQEVVKLRVVRPSLYDLSDDEKDCDAGEKEKKEDNEGEEADDGDKLVEEEQDEAKVLDVDDSAKDATSQPVP
ncbi:hypothetical protein QBC37DRAFT_63096 [Rhypophila decipiens]|uniref:Calpain catalytic domain-containing protein n=1 Tax=Rhypophila decipiens TaxID=261697 RepID=A0AAN6YEH1_9PEZI|nr:hypothetical protein QBC37DRAFT_63096 [Rhypophila decipiens]